MCRGLKVYKVENKPKTSGESMELVSNIVSSAMGRIKDNLVY
ncbi:uncharacterized protein J3R85_012372 [Psidium guajava]|nr:uncharacterized protein J3R85_012372 [Psidium guajava]